MAPDLVARYNGAFREVLSEPPVRETLGKHGVSVRLSTPEELDRINREDYETLAKLVKDAHIKGD
jgi:tripartite-type tricarboxylate transporter receptor subunit TctC